MKSYFDSLYDAIECGEGALNMPLFERVHLMSLEQDSRTSYIISGDELTHVPTWLSDRNIIVLPMFGLDSDAIGDVDSEFNLDIKPKADGTRVSCLMLADDTVALTSSAPHWADVGHEDDFHILWLFDNEALLSSYEINDDVLDELQIASAIAEDHKPLTSEESHAWQRLAAQAEFVGIFECINLAND
ncbi:hypothetical protein [Paraburkholderia sp. C35]|uniref:hypothetical protein n=1 Tax=Paraburkholderia sp. C35 TaxID=2126993 RepID=UPI000D69B87B|nr:hypothetical protein [Paraburkholderia sp. C35]